MLYKLLWSFDRQGADFWTIHGAFDNERYNFERVNINDKNSLYLGRVNEDCILKIFGTFTKEEFIKMVKSAKVLK